MKDLESCKTAWKKSKFNGSFQQVFDANISAITHFVVDCVAKLVFASVVFADSSAPTLWCSLLSPSLPSSLALGTVVLTLIEQMVAGFSSISPFAMFSKSVNDFTISFGTVLLFRILLYKGWAGHHGCLYCLNKLSASQVCVYL